MTSFVAGEWIGVGNPTHFTIDGQTVTGYQDAIYFVNAEQTQYVATAHVISSNNLPILSSVKTMIENIDDVKFSSHYFDYLTINTTLDLQVDLPSRTTIATATGKKGKDVRYTPNIGAVSYNLFTGNFGYTPMFICYDIDTGRVVTTSNLYVVGNSMRVLQMSVTDTQVNVVDQYQVFDNALPAFTFRVRVYLLDQGLDIPRVGLTNNAFFANSSVVEIGQGRINSTKRYLVVDDASPIRMPVDRALKASLYPTTGEEGRSGTATLELWREGALVGRIGTVGPGDPFPYEGWLRSGAGLTRGIRQP